MQNEVVTKVATATTEKDEQKSDQLLNTKSNAIKNIDSIEDTQKTHGTELPSFSLDSIRKEAIKYFNGDELAAEVWINKYSLKDSKGNVYELTPDDMHRRLAKEIARIEKEYEKPLTEDKIFDLLKGFKYIIPQGGPMSGIGNNFQISSLSNCFVIGKGDRADSYGGIMKIDEEQVQLMKRRGGVGHDLSHIRPQGSSVQNTALSSTGIVPFMERYSNSTREVAQDGRRGALMLSISSRHPDAESFIDAKMELGKVTGANVSVRIDDDFMRKMISNEKYVQQYPINSDDPKITKEIDAKALWDKIVHNAWKSAEPGILFWDTIIRESVADCYADLGFATVSTNPCGEIPLCPYDSCRLLAINLYSYVQNPFTENAYFDSELFADHVKCAQRIMDDIIDLELEKIDAIITKINCDPEGLEIKGTELDLWKNIKKKCVEGRRTGIGITAEGDMIAALGIQYGSDQAIDFSTKVHQTLALECYRSSVQLAKDRGPFPIYDADKEMNNPFINRIKKADPALYEEMKKYGRRNIALLTIAPTGTTSLMSQTSSGVEPVFMVAYKRRRKVNPNDKNVKVSFIDEVGDSWEEYHVFHHKFITWLEVNGHNVEEVENMKEEDLNKVIEKSPYYKSTSNDIDWVQKVKMQGDIQKWVDHSISVTVNIPNDATEELVGEIYKTAWKSGCKGITVYREGSRSGVLVSNKEANEKEFEFKETQAPKRPKKMESEIIRFQNNHEKWIAFIGLLNNRPYEIFTGKEEDDTFLIPKSITKGWVIKNHVGSGKKRYDFQYEDKHGYKTTIEGLSRFFNKTYWNYAKLISGVLRHGMPLQFVVNLVSNLNLNDDSINTWKNGVDRALRKFIPNGTEAVNKSCPECGDPSGLIYEEGCLRCKGCGHSKCG
ncbi:MAG TPA: adenosylcobalamin-dependent ribonucleoside-diphosphate reductase [Flavobacteriales bacterium]|nr:adenosylcobalamin-dependent ribonucleoside-diphosphate reductase [Flavobacteriales bacterium]HIN39907.1 adenosylcobalamin-dependent ribonucleoside-diphosphate reductase [Flavobacteriales bacterium]